MLPRSLHLRLALAGALLLLYTAQFWLFAGWAIDDPWISFQYARHLAEGKGLVFNPGERVEGYSNFLWVMQMAAAHKMGFDMLTAAKTLGFVFGLLPILLACSVMIFSKYKPIQGSGAEEFMSSRSFLFALLLCLSGHWAFWSAGGLETVQFAILVCLFIMILKILLISIKVRENLDEEWIIHRKQIFRKLTISAGVLALLIAMSRPEGALFGVIGFFIILISMTQYKRSNKSIASYSYLLLSFFLIFIIPFIAFSFWRRWYFGGWLPNTFYAKAYAAFVSQMFLGFEYLIKYLVLYSFPVLFGFVLSVWVSVNSSQSKLRLTFPVKYTGEIFILIYFLFIIFVGGDWMPMGRFIVHILPILALEAGIGIHCIIYGDKYFNVKSIIKYVVVAFLIVSLIVTVAYQYKETAPILERVRAGAFWQPLVTAGEWLRENTPPEAVVAGEEAGIIPFTSRRRFIDMLGIVDPHVARMKGALHEKYDAAYVLGRAPDYILLHVTKDTGVGVYPSSRDMLAQPDFQARYAEAHRVVIGLAKFAETPEHYNNLVIYRRTRE